MGKDIKQGTPSHSVKVPRIYKLSAGILTSHLRGEGSVKDLVYKQITKNNHPRVKAIFALVSEAARNESLLTHLFSATQLIENEYPLDPSLAKILATELLWGKGLSRAGNSKPVTTILRYETKIKANVSEKDTVKKPVAKSQIPRYVRINRLKATDLNRVVATLKYDGYNEVSYKRENILYPEFAELARNLKVNHFLLDYHFQDLLAFGAGTTFFDYKLYNEGILILQDKASCLAVEALNPPQGSFVLDACAAPGMKTLQAVTKTISCDSKNYSVIAVERDTKRCKTLRSLMQKFGADNIQIINNDFLNVDPNVYPEVDYIILDPSCSGSGIFHRDDLPEKGDLDQRLQKLASLQAKLLRHALSFPNVKRVAYSTCSVYKRENEDVVMEVLNGGGCFAPLNDFELQTNCLPNWERRGLSEFGNIAERFIRSNPKEDLGIGFFVAILKRINGSNELCQKSNKRKHSENCDVKKKRANKK